MRWPVGYGSAADGADGTRRRWLLRECAGERDATLVAASGESDGGCVSATRWNELR